MASRPYFVYIAHSLFQKRGVPQTPIQSFLHRYYQNFLDLMENENAIRKLLRKCNIIKYDIPKLEEWRTLAELVEKRCNGYWRSVLILDHLDELRDTDNGPCLWKTIQMVLGYWQEHQTRVVFTCRNYPKEISCYTWRIGDLTGEEARKVFFSACTSKRYRNISFLEPDRSVKAKRKAIDVAYSFEDYFHYIPNYASPLVRQVLDIMEHLEDIEDYKLANMNHIMGDIQRLLARKRRQWSITRKL